jgi:hypothetical protein
MNEFFGKIYDTLFGIFNNLYFLIFQHLYDNGGYVKLGLSFILIPLVCWLLFYYLWKYPYGKLWHWLVWMAVTVLIVICATYGIANTEILGSDNQALNEAIADASTGYGDYAATLPLKYAMANSLLALIIGFIYSLIMKQFSKIQLHLPF